MFNLGSRPPQSTRTEDVLGTPDTSLRGRRTRKALSALTSKLASPPSPCMRKSSAPLIKLQIGGTFKLGSLKMFVLCHINAVVWLTAARRRYRQQYFIIPKKHLTCGPHIRCIFWKQNNTFLKTNPLTQWRRWENRESSILNVYTPPGGGRTRRL